MARYKLRTVVEYPERTRKDYKRIFEYYPDLVNTKQVRNMLGGVNDKTVYKLLRNGNLKGFRIGKEWHIPKNSVIDYVLSEHYQNYRQILKHQVKDSP